MGVQGPSPCDVLTTEHVMEYETACLKYLDSPMFTSDLPGLAPTSPCTPTELLTEAATSAIAVVGDVSDTESDMLELVSDEGCLTWLLPSA